MLSYFNKKNCFAMSIFIVIHTTFWLLYSSSVVCLYSNLLGILNWILYSIHRGRLFSFCLPCIVDFFFFNISFYSLVLLTVVLLLCFCNWARVKDSSALLNPRIELVGIQCILISTLIHLFIYHVANINTNTKYNFLLFMEKLL